jgi:hypothetical protein
MIEPSNIFDPRQFIMSYEVAVVVAETRNDATLAKSFVIVAHDTTQGRCWYLSTQIEYEGFRKRTEYHCTILPGVFQVSLFIFYHRETME